MLRLLLLALLAVTSSAAVADPPSGPPGLTKKGGVPPGLAKKGGVPPGLARKFGGAVPVNAYIAIDPRYDDRAWFLIEGRWILKKGFDAGLRAEVRWAMSLPVAVPPVPPPGGVIDLRIVVFS